MAGDGGGATIFFLLKKGSRLKTILWEGLKFKYY
jgi:hypothetical protein